MFGLCCGSVRVAGREGVGVYFLNALPLRAHITRTRMWPNTKFNGTVVQIRRLAHLPCKLSRQSRDSLCICKVLRVVVLQGSNCFGFI